MASLETNDKGHKKDINAVPTKIGRSQAATRVVLIYTWGKGF